MPVASPPCTPTITDDIWTVRELCAFLRVSHHTLASWRYLGKGPRFFHLDRGRAGRVYYRKQDVEDWLRTIPLRPGWDAPNE